MENFWSGKTVLITGHTGFKGSWLSIWLNHLGANVVGYSLPPENPSNFDICRVDELVHSIEADINDIDRLKGCFETHQPEVVFHLAAQSLVRKSYSEPIETYQTNVIGTANVLEAIRSCPSVRSVIVVTSDKCYENKEWVWGYREDEPMGGHDPYSSSKGCAELVTASFRASFFNPDEYARHKVGVATVRAGNVIGGGDWASDRLIPDILKSHSQAKKLIIRNPSAIRPWQFVLEPLHGYMVLAERLYTDGPQFSQAWNFGPRDEDVLPVEDLVKKLSALLKDGIDYDIESTGNPHEAMYLKLDCSKASTYLGWYPRTSINNALNFIAEWHTAFLTKKNMQDVSRAQIVAFQSLKKAAT